MNEADGTLPTAAQAAAAGEVLWAHHPLLIAIPAFVPAIVVVGVVVYIARKDRADEARELAEERRRDETDSPPEDPA